MKIINNLKLFRVAFLCFLMIQIVSIGFGTETTEVQATSIDRIKTGSKVCIKDNKLPKNHPLYECKEYASEYITGTQIRDTYVTPVQRSLQSSIDKTTRDLEQVKTQLTTKIDANLTAITQIKAELVKQKQDHNSEVLRIEQSVQTALSTIPNAVFNEAFVQMMKAEIRKIVQEELAKRNNN